MSNLKLSLFGAGTEKSQEMFFSKSIAFDEEDLAGVAVSATTAAAAGPVSAAVSSATIENEFLENLKAGDAEAFDQLVVRYSADVYAFLIRLTEDPEEARDLTQETFLRALKSVKNFRGDADLKTWLFRIAINESRNRFRWWKRRRLNVTISLDARNPTTETPLGETLSAADAAANPEAETLRREREKALRQALGELPENFRVVVILRDIEGFAYEEIAAALETNVGTVKSRIARGREELRRKLNGF
jgi:RNA polymerase sigma-70 factor, ECF subfamily